MLPKPTNRREFVMLKHAERVQQLLNDGGAPAAYRSDSWHVLKLSAEDSEYARQLIEEL